jgi:hypothetical protein
MRHREIEIRRRQLINRKSSVATLMEVRLWLIPYDFPLEFCGIFRNMYQRLGWWLNTALGFMPIYRISEQFGYPGDASGKQGPNKP